MKITRQGIFSVLEDIFCWECYVIAHGLNAGQQHCLLHLFFSKIFHIVILTIPCNLSMQFKHTFLALSNNNKSLEILRKRKAHLYTDHTYPMYSS